MLGKSPGEGTEGPAKGQGLRFSAFIASLVEVGLLITFMIQNTEDVTLDFLFWSFTLPLWVFTLVVAVVGALVWIGLGVMRRHRRRVTRREGRAN
jgi:uncharacterized integral membrane protein